MRRLSMATMIGLTLVLIQATFVRADDPSSGTKPDPRDDTSQLVITGKLLGQLTAFDPEAKTFTLKVTTRNLVPNQSAVDERKRLQQQLADTAKIKDPKERQNKINDLAGQLARNEPNLVKVEEKSQDYQLQAHDDMRVRTALLPAVFDEKGNPRKYTLEELKEIRDTVYPEVYRAALSDIHAQQHVVAYIGGKKGDAPVKQPSPSDPKDPKDPKDPPLRLTVMMLVIVGKPG